MIAKRIGSAALSLVAAVLLGIASAHAADITVLSSTALKSVLTELAPQFEKTTGAKLDITYDASNLLTKEIQGGKAFDVTVLTPGLINELIKQGKVAEGSAANIARAGSGVAVRTGAPKPDIGSVEAFKRALLDAKSIAFTTAGQSGVHFASVIEKLGIAAEVKAKAKTVPSGSAAALIVKGEAEMAVQLIPELMAVSGVDVVGPFPSELQAYVVLTAGLAPNPKNKDAAQALIKFLAEPAATQIIKAKGLQPG